MTVRHPSPNRYLLVGVAALALALAACGSDQDTTDETTTPTSTTAETTTETTSSTTPTTPSDTTEPPAPVEDPVDPAPDAAPYVTECLEGTPGPAMWSDGTMAYSEDCWLNNGGPAYAEAEGNATEQFWRDNPHLLEEPQRADGCVGPAAVCGYYDDSGQPIWFDKETGETSPRYYDEDGNPTMDPQ